jgi:farnesyl-diphosphate farnesyltransferase
MNNSLEGHKAEGKVDDIHDRLRGILKQVSRSFYLSLAILPSPLQTPMGLAYLLARAADTIADTRIVTRADRLHFLDVFRQELECPSPSRLAEIAQALTGPQETPAERELLLCLPESFATFGAQPEEDRVRIRGLLLALTYGMQEDLRNFPGESQEHLVALESRGELDRYTYYAAGCVGEFWTDMVIAHCPAMHGWDASAMRARGKRFGQGLQMTNVLRDVAQDLRIGRCYLPRQDLVELGLSPKDLLDPSTVERLQPLLRDMLCITLSHYAEGWTYLLAIPPTEIRMRLACAWPLLIGLRTLDLIQQARNFLDPRTPVKISRPAVYKIMARSAALAWSDVGLGRYYRVLRRRIDMAPILFS